MKQPVRIVSVAMSSLLLTVSASAQSSGYTPPSARTYAGDVERPLTAPTNASPESVVSAFLKDRGIDVGERSLVRERDPIAGLNGVVVLRFGQTVAGVKLYGSYAKAAFTRQGELVHLIENLAGSLPEALAAPGITEAQALRGALAHLYPGRSIALGAARRQQNSVVFERTPFFHAGPRVTRVAFRDEQGNIRPGLLVETWREEGNQLHHTLLGPRGQILFTENRTNSDSYNIFAISPRVSAQTVVDGPAAGGTVSPLGWLSAGPQSSIDITGNNVHSYLDVVSNNSPDRGGVPVSDGNFLMAADLLRAPSLETNRDVAVQNLFYLNNAAHDILYAHGFTEAAGNFQEDNFNRGGLAADSVNAEAQDGRGENNANFATPADGSHPRMQMYLFSGVGGHEVFVTAPSSITGSYRAIVAAFGDALRRPLSGAVVVASDGAGVSSTDGCEPLQGPVAGNIVLVDRGSCTFVLKAANAQAAGAVGLIIANNTGGNDIETPGGDDRTIDIPVVMISQNDGATLKGASGVQAAMQPASTDPLAIDSALDSDIVYHEYGHGLTWRMIGGMSGPIAGALGEGASDVLAMLINGDDSIAEYSVSNSRGLRRAPYGAYPNTYGDITGASVHNDGEIYAAIMWRLVTLVGNTPANREELLTYFVQAMNHIPVRPTYEDMRDGLLQVAPTRLDCTVWNAFAAFGVGEGSSATVTSGGLVVSESFTVPTPCRRGGR